VRGSNVAGDNSASYVGCINAPTGTADLGSTATSACPSTLPVANPAGADYTFFVASGIAVSGPPTVTVGNIIECRVKDATRQCGSLLPVRSFDSTTPAGCFALAGTLTTCPTATSFTNANGYTMNLWGAVSATDPTARLEACVTPAQATASQRTCSGYLPANTYTVPATGESMGVAPPADGVAGSALIGCVKASTLCPAATPYPLIGRTASGDLTIQACRAGQSTCAATFMPLCNADSADVVPSTTGATTCSAAATTNGCLLQGGPISQCATLSANKFPIGANTANPYKFVAAIQNQQTATLLACATMGENATPNPVTVCKAGTTFKQRAYPAGEEQQGSLYACLSDVQQAHAQQTQNAML
jgi:hypothetical protein